VKCIMLASLQHVKTVEAALKETAILLLVTAHQVIHISILYLSTVIVSFIQLIICMHCRSTENVLLSIFLTLTSETDFQKSFALGLRS